MSLEDTLEQMDVELKQLTKEQIRVISKAKARNLKPVFPEGIKKDSCYFLFGPSIGGFLNSLLGLTGAKVYLHELGHKTFYEIFCNLKDWRIQVDQWEQQNLWDFLIWADVHNDGNAGYFSGFWGSSLNELGEFVGRDTARTFGLMGGYIFHAALAYGLLFYGIKNFKKNPLLAGVAATVGGITTLEAIGGSGIFEAIANTDKLLTYYHNPTWENWSAVKDLRTDFPQIVKLLGEKGVALAWASLLVPIIGLSAYLGYKLYKNHKYNNRLSLSRLDHGNGYDEKAQATYNLLSEIYGKNQEIKELENELTEIAVNLLEEGIEVDSLDKEIKKTSKKKFSRLVNLYKEKDKYLLKKLGKSKQIKNEKKAFEEYEEELETNNEDIRFIKNGLDTSLNDACSLYEFILKKQYDFIEKPKKQEKIAREFAKKIFYDGPLEKVVSALNGFYNNVMLNNEEVFNDDFKDLIGYCRQKYSLTFFEKTRDITQAPIAGNKPIAGISQSV